MPPFYSSRAAVGVIVAVGNIGRAVSDEPADLRTYLSRDAGLTWSEIYKEATIYEVGDHGGVLVFASWFTPTNQIMYSLDEGKSFTILNFSTTAVDVENIRVEQDNTGLKFILHGVDTSANAEVVYTLDFTDNQPRACTDSDYEMWSPSDGAHGDAHCVLGQTTVYKRRKQDAACYNSDVGTDHVNSTTPCPCAWEDYECDAGWWPSAGGRNATGGFECKNQSSTQYPQYCTPGASFYVIPTGYQKITGNKCVGGLDLQPKNISCVPGGTTGGHRHGTGDGHSIAVAAGVLVVVAVAVAVGVVVWRKPTFLGDVLAKLRRRDRYSDSSAGYATVAQDEEF